MGSQISTLRGPEPYPLATTAGDVNYGNNVNRCRNYVVRRDEETTVEVPASSLSPQKYESCGDSDVDRSSREYCGCRTRELSGEHELSPQTAETFGLERPDPVACYLELDGERISAVPAFDAPPTTADG